jgi:hypothetical protein
MGGLFTRIGTNYLSVPTPPRTDRALIGLTNAARDGPTGPAAVPGSITATRIIVIVVMGAMANPHLHRAGRRCAYGSCRSNDGERGGQFRAPSSFQGSINARKGGVVPA